MDDLDLIEQTLLALDGREDELRLTLFERFFARFPDRRREFLAFDASSRRMTDETLQLLHGLAGNAHWVTTQVADLVDLHRNYGDFALAEFDCFTELAAQTVCDLAEATAAQRAAWTRQTTRLKPMLGLAHTDWKVAIGH